MATAAESVALSSLAYLGPNANWSNVSLPPNWQYVTNSAAYNIGVQTDYFGVAFKNKETGEIVVASRGSTMNNDGQDWIESDADIGLSVVPPAFNDAQAFAQKIMQDYAAPDYYAVGHSLGGAEAQYIAAKMGWDGATFGAPGAAFAVGGATANVTNYVMDPIGAFGTHVGTVQVLVPNGPDQVADLLLLGPLGLHPIGNYLEYFGAAGAQTDLGIDLANAINSFLGMAGFLLPSNSAPPPPPAGPVAETDESISPTSAGNGGLSVGSALDTALTRWMESMGLQAGATFGTTSDGNGLQINGIDSAGNPLTAVISDSGQSTTTETNSEGQPNQQYIALANGTYSYEKADPSGATGWAPQSINSSGAQEQTVETSNATVVTAPSTQTEINGTNDTINLGANDTLTAVGGGNTVNGGASDQISVSGTGGSFDTVYASGANQASGNNGGISLDDNAQANIGGSNDTITLGSGDSLGAYGGGNTINNAGAGDLVVVGATNGSFDTVFATGALGGGTTANGQATGIFLNPNTQVNLGGSNDTITLAGGDTLGAYGGGNTVTDVGAGDLVAIGNTGGSYDTVDATGDQSGGTTANGQGTGITLNSDCQVDVQGSNNSVTAASGDSVGAYGGDNTVTNVGAGDLVTIGGTGGSFDTLYATGDQGGGTTADGEATGITLNSDSQLNLGGSDDTVGIAGGDTLGIYGGGNTINDVGAGDLVAVGATNGDFDTIYATGDLGGGTTANGQATGITLNPDSQVSLGGGNNAITVAGGDTLGAYGGDNTITNVGAGDLVTIGATNGDFDTIYATGDLGGGTTANGQATGISLNPDTQVNLGGSNDTITLAGGDTLGAYGGGNTITNVGAGDLVAIGNTGGSYDTVYASGAQSSGATANGQEAGITLNANSQVYLDGSNDTVTLYGGDSLGVDGGGNVIANAGSGDRVGISNTGGSFDTVYASGDYFSLGGTADGQPTGIYLSSNAQANIVGNDDAIEATSNDAIDVTGQNDGVFTSGDDINVGPSSVVSVNGTNDTVSACNGDAISVSSPSDTVSVTGFVQALYSLTSGGSALYDYNDPEYASVYRLGWTYDQPSASGDLTEIDADWAAGGSQDTTYDYSNGLETGFDVSDYNVIGEFVGSGSYDSEGDLLSTSGDYSGYTSFDDSGSDFAGAQVVGQGKSVNVSTIVNFDNSHGHNGGATAAQAAAGWVSTLEADESSMSDTAKKHSVFEGGRWNSPVITWSIGHGAGIGPSAFSGGLGTQYEAIVQQAFAAWGKASGLTFEEVPDTPNTDITIGWSKLDPANSGLIGFTSGGKQNGALQQGVTIQLEDPTEDPLIADLNGQLSYQETPTNFYDLVMHEIGHALGLADNADPNSVMYYAGGSGKLDGGDLIGVTALYGAVAGNAGPTVSLPGAGGSSTDVSLQQFVQAVAGISANAPPAMSSGTTPFAFSGGDPAQPGWVAPPSQAHAA